MMADGFYSRPGELCIKILYDPRLTPDASVALT